MKITVKTLKPRNPIVGAARFRLAGAHRRGTGSQRLEGMRALRRELDQMKNSP